MSISRGEREREHAQKKMFVYMCRAYVYSIHLDYVCIYIYTKEGYTVLNQKITKFPTTPYTHTHANKNKHKNNTRPGREAPGASSWPQD
jgi:3-methyladenine DNA glycosylase Mpg